MLQLSRKCNFNFGLYACLTISLGIKLGNEPNECLRTNRIGFQVPNNACLTDLQYCTLHSAMKNCLQALLLHKPSRYFEMHFVGSIAVSAKAHH